MLSKPYTNIIRFTKSLDQFGKIFFLIVMLSMLSAGVVLLYPYLFSRVVNFFQNKNLYPLLIFLGAYILIQILSTAIQAITGYVRRNYALIANKKVIHSFYEVVQSLPLKVFKGFQNNGEIYQRVIDSLELNHIVIDVATGLVIVILSFLIYIGILFSIHWGIGILILLIAPVYYLLNKIYSPRIQHLQQQSLLNNSPLTNHLFDCLNRIVTIKALGAKDQVMKEVKRLVDANALHQKNLFKCQTKVSFINDTISQLFVLIVISVAGFLMFKGHISIAEGLVILVLIQKVFSPLQSALSLIIDLNRAGVILERFYEIMNEKSEQDTQKDVKAARLNKAVSVQFKDVVFSYNTKPVIKKIDLIIPAGKRVAFVGRTGVGKSTLMNLILGLYKPQDGAILIQQDNLDELDLNLYRKQIGVVLQNEFIFPGTVRENATFGLERAVTDEELSRALKNACLWNRIKTMELGLHTHIKDDMLSGGEKQRLTIARAFLRDPQLILFDEPTSSLDMTTEAELQKAMDRLLAGRTSITIAHRLSTIKKSDIIFVLDEGQIIERGTHEELVALKGYYAALYEQSIVA